MENNIEFFDAQLKCSFEFRNENFYPVFYIDLDIDSTASSTGFSLQPVKYSVKNTVWTKPIQIRVNLVYIHTYSVYYTLDYTMIHYNAICNAICNDHIYMCIH